MSAASKRNFGIIACHARKSLNDNSQPHSKSGNSARDKVNWIDLAVPGVRVGSVAKIRGVALVG